MNYIAELLFIAVNIIMARIDASRISKGKRIYHGINGAAYLVIAGVVSYFLSSWWLFYSSLVLRKVVFDMALNHFRGKDWLYISPEPKSIVDKVHYFFFGEYAEIYITFYALKLLFLNVFVLR